MTVFFFLLAVAALAAMLVGLFSPRLVVRWGAPEKRTRLKSFMTYSLAFLIFALAMGASVPEEERTRQAKEKAAALAAAEPVQQATSVAEEAEPAPVVYVSQSTSPAPAFDITAEVFLQRFNAAGQVHDLPWLKFTKRMPMEDGPGSVIQCSADDYMAAILRANGSKLLVEATLIQKVPENDPTRVLLGMASLMDAISPGLTANDRGDILQRLGLLGGGDLPKSSTCEYRGVKYSWTASDTIGLWLSASPAK